MGKGVNVSKFTQLRKFTGNKQSCEAGLVCLDHKEIWLQSEGWINRLVTMRRKWRNKREKR